MNPIAVNIVRIWSTVPGGRWMPFFARCAVMLAGVTFLCFRTHLCTRWHISAKVSSFAWTGYGMSFSVNSGVDGDGDVNDITTGEGGGAGRVALAFSMSSSDINPSILRVLKINANTQ
jgi:hypothetical protein